MGSGTAFEQVDTHMLKSVWMAYSRKLDHGERTPPQGVERTALHARLPTRVQGAGLHGHRCS